MSSCCWCPRCGWSAVRARRLIHWPCSKPFETAKPVPGQSDGGVWLLQGRQMAALVEDDQARVGNETAHLCAVPRGGQSVFPTPDEKRRTDDSGQIGAAVSPTEERRVLSHEHGGTGLAGHATKAARCADGVGSALVRDRAGQLLDNIVEFPALHAMVSPACGCGICVRPGIAAHEP